MATGRWVSLDKETVIGTANAASRRYIGIDMETLEPKPIQNLVVRSAKSQPVASHGYGIPATGDIKMVAVSPADILFFLRGLMGLENYTFTTNTPVAGVGQHVFAGFNNKPIDGTNGGTLSTEYIIVNYEVNQIAYPGCFFNSMTIRQDIGQPAEITFGVISTTNLPVKAVGDGTQNPPQQRGWGNYDPNQANPNFGSGSFDVFNQYSGGSSMRQMIKTIEIRIDRGYDPNLFTSLSLQTLSGQSPGPTRITGTITTDFSDAVGGNSAIADLLARTERGIRFGWNGDILTGTTRSFLSLQIQNLIWTGGVPHMRTGRTPPGYEGAFTFEAYEAVSPGLNLTVYGENATIA